MPTQTLSFYSRGITNSSATTIGNAALFMFDSPSRTLGQLWIKSAPISFGNESVGATVAALSMIGLGSTVLRDPVTSEIPVLGKATFEATLDIKARMNLQFNPALISFGSVFQAQMTDLDVDGFDDGKMFFSAFLDIAPKNVMEWERGDAQLWTPDWLGGELLGYFDARRFRSQADGYGVTLWPDGSQYKKNAVVGDIIPPHAYPSVNAVDFDPADLNYFTWALSSSDMNRTVVAVVNVASVTNPRGVLGASASGGLVFRVNSSQKLQWVKQNTTDITTSTLSVPLMADVLLSGSIDASNWNSAINGTLQTGSHAVTLTSSLTSRIGRSHSSEYFDGYIKVILVATRRTLEEQQQMEGWAAWEFGLQDSLDASHPYKYAPPTVRSFE